MATYAVVDAGGKIVNRVVLDDVGSWTPPDGHSLVDEKTTPMEIGGTLVKSTYTPPARPAVRPIPAFDQFDVWDAISMKIAFNHENRIRALEGKQPMTAAQFKSAVKALIA